MTAKRKHRLVSLGVVVACFSGEFLWAFSSIAFGVPMGVYAIISLAGVIVPAIGSINNAS